MATNRSTTRSVAKAPPAPKQRSGAELKPVAIRRESGGIQSIERAIAIVDLVARNPEGISLAVLSSQLGLNNSTVFHLAKTLDKLNIIAQVPETKRYRIGSHLFTLAAGALNETTLLAFATPLLERLSQTTGESANLAIRSQNEVIVIARTAATSMLQLSSRTGTTRPVHVTATGKALLSTMADDDLEKLLEAHSFQVFTPKSITSREALRKELEEVRKTGLAYDRCEFDADVTCVATTVQDFAGRHVASIGVSGPVWRMTPKLMQKKSKELRKAAADLSAQLGSCSWRI